MCALDHFRVCLLQNFVLQKTERKRVREEGDDPPFPPLPAKRLKIALSLNLHLNRCLNHLKAIARVLGAFDVLPTEITYHVLTFLSGRDLLSMAATSKSFANLAEDEPLWKASCQREFGPVRNKLHLRFGKSWRWLYVTKSNRLQRNRIVGRAIGHVVEDEVVLEGEWDGPFLQGYGSGYSLLAGAWDEGLFIEGHWRNHELHGYGREEWSDGEYLEGEWLCDALNGKGLHRWKDGSWYKGEFKANLQDGQGAMRYRDGACYLGEWKEGERHGKGMMVFANGDNYEGLWEKGQPHGIGVMKYADGSNYAGEWKQGKRHGKGRLTTRECYFEGSFWNDKKDGDGTCRFSDGRWLRGSWFHDHPIASLSRSL